MSQAPHSEARRSDGRQHRRHQYNGRVTLSGIGVSTPLNGVIVDLSSGGCLIRLPATADLEIGSVVDISLQSNYLSLRARGSVCHFRDEQCVVGISFQELSTRGRNDLRELITDLALSAVPEPSL